MKVYILYTMEYGGEWIVQSVHKTENGAISEGERLRKEREDVYQISDFGVED